MPELGQAAGDVEWTAANVFGQDLAVADDDVNQRLTQAQDRGVVAGAGGGSGGCTGHEGSL